MGPGLQIPVGVLVFGPGLQRESWGWVARWGRDVRPGTGHGGVSG